MARLPGLVRLVLPDIGEDKPDQGGNAGQKARQIQQRDDGRPVEVETRVRRCGGRRNAVGHAIPHWTSLFPARACADPFSNAIGSPHFRVKMETRSEEHTSELQSLMRNTYAVFCLKN